MASERKKWEDRDIKILISLYEENNLLWDVKSVSYRDRIKKQKCLEEIAAKFETTVAEVSGKLHNLRSQYMQEVKKIKSKKSGAGTEEISMSNWPYFSALQFIGNSTDNSATTSNLQLGEINEYSKELEKHPEEIMMEQPHIRKKIKKDKEIIGESDIQKALQIIQPNDQEQIFADYVASELRQLKNAENKRKLRRLINEAIMQVSDADSNELLYLLELS